MVVAVAVVVVVDVVVVVVVVSAGLVVYGVVSAVAAWLVFDAAAVVAVGSSCS